jgi:hypothetical protein
MYKIPERTCKRSTTMAIVSFLDHRLFCENFGIRKEIVDKNNKWQQIIFCHVKLPCVVLGPVSMSTALISIPVSVRHREYKKGLNVKTSL